MMTDPKIAGYLRDRGYEALLILSSFAEMALRPTLRNAMELDSRVCRALDRRAGLKALQQRGLVAESPCKNGTILRLTKLGRMALAGGREPEAAWNRPWDGRWRVLNFDIPRREAKARARFWRWLRLNHFGKLQGSVWIRPDPIDDIEATATDAGFDPAELIAFDSDLIGKQNPETLVARAWRFNALNDGYRNYLTFANRTARQIRKKVPSRPRLRELLRADRDNWWRAARRDPLLPKEIHPSSYEGPRAWEARQALHRAFFQAISQDNPE